MLMFNDMEKEITSTCYQLPPLELLDEYASEGNVVSIGKTALDEKAASERKVVPDEEIAGKTESIRTALGKGKVPVKDIKAVPGPAVTLYKVYPERGVRISKVRTLMEDMALDLHLKGVRVGTLEDSIGIEIANDHRASVPMRSVLRDDAFRNCKAELPVAIGRTFGNKVKVFDLAKAPHLLIAGATKQGKTMAIHTVVASLLYSKRPEELKFVFLDPKGCEFSAYSRLGGHYLATLSGENPIVKTKDQAGKTLEALCEEMEARYSHLSVGSISNIVEYNKQASTPQERWPYIVTIIDEYADLTISVSRDKESGNMSHNIASSIIHLAQKGSAVGIHVILATQRPSKDVITSPIKANFPTRIAVRTASKTDSRAILDTPGAESLIGGGDMILQTGGEAVRLQGAYINPEEIARLTSYVESCPGSGSPCCLPTSSPSEP